MKFLFDLFYSQKIFSELDHKLIRSNNDNFIKDFNYVEAERYLKINLRADVFINICSMQEMNYVDIKNYFSSIRNQNSETWFYSCNRVSKNLPDGTVIKFDKYGWDEKDISIFDELNTLFVIMFTQRKIITENNIDNLTRFLGLILFKKFILTSICFFNLDELYVYPKT